MGIILLGSSNSLSGIKSVICNYYYIPAVALINTSTIGEYEVHNRKGKIKGVRVIEKSKGKRFRFEML